MNTYEPILDLVLKYKYILYCQEQNLEIDYSIDKNIIERQIYELLTPKELKIYLNKASSYIRKKVRLKRRIEFMIQNHTCYFCTLTFNEDSLRRFKNEKRVRIAIQKYLMSLDCFYIGNADYGGLNGRLHYHVILNRKPSKDGYKYGFMDIKKINLGSSGRIANYLLKLTNHALKQTSHDMILYSRSDEHSFKKLGL